jgi:hypothetical protein
MMPKSSDFDDRNTLYCSFCGKSQHQVKTLIAGPTVFICNECVHACMEIIGDEKVAAGAPRSSPIAEGPKTNASSFHFSEARIIRLDSDDDFLAIEREMNDLSWHWYARRKDDRLLDQYWGLYSIVAKTNPTGLTSAAVKLRLLLHPDLGMEIGERAEDYIALRQILGTLEHEISRQRAAAPDDGLTANDIGFGELEPRR